MKNRSTLTFALISLFLLSACSEEWSGVVYPDSNNLNKSVGIGKFSSLEACRDAAFYHIEENKFTNADYECGLNCNYNKDYDFEVCEKTAQ